MKNLHTLLLCIALLCCAYVHAQRSNCAAYPDLIEVKQPDGSKNALYILGNEVFHYYSTPDGYTVLQNPLHNGQYEYAIPAANGFIQPGGIAVGTSMQKTGIEKGLKPGPAQIKQAYQSFMGKTPASAFNKTGKNGIFPSQGTRKLLVVLMQYPDETTSFSSESFERFMSEPGYSDNGCAGSFRDYYLANSSGALDLDVTVIGWYTASRPRAEYGQTDSLGNSNPNYNNNVQELVAQTIDSAEAAGVNFADYDNDGDGDMDGLVIFHAGFGAEQGKNGYIWSHRWTLWSNYERNYDGVSIRNYCINPSKRDFGAGTTQVRVGVVSHEFGHVLGLPDLYDTDNLSEGAGNWCIMAGGGWLNNESNPSRMNAWCKTEMGWLTPTPITALGKYSLTNTTDSNIAFIVNTSVSNEYFLLENRQRKAWDKYLPGKGLAIWHINTNKADNYRLFGSNDVNNDTSMYGVGLVQADGLRELEKKINRGSLGDLYPGSANNRSFSDNSNPRSVLHERDINGDPVSSNITLMDITQMPDSTVTFNFGGIPSASFKPSVITGCAPLLVSFVNQSVFSSAYSWDLGNGQTSTTSSPTASYSSAGTYSVSLVVYDETNAAKDTFITTITVNAAPKASFTFTRDNDKIIFKNTSTGADYYAWRFASGGSSFSTDPVFTFTQPTSFYMVAYNNNGCKDTAYGNLWNTGIGEAQGNLSGLQVHPNPVKDIALLSFQLTQSSDVHISIVNVLGQEVYTDNVLSIPSGKQELNIPTRSFAQPGLYYVKMKSGDQETVQRLIKQ